MLAGQLAALGGCYFAGARRMVSEAEVLARRSSHAPTIGLARMCKAVVGYFAGEFNAAADDLIAVEQLFLSNCHGMRWELSTTRSFTCFALRLTGRLRELCERFDRYTADADRTGDRYLVANLRTYQSIVWLIRDDLPRAARDIEGILDAWPADMYQVQHFFYLYGRCEQALYGEDPEGGLAGDCRRGGPPAALLVAQGQRPAYRERLVARPGRPGLGREGAARPAGHGSRWREPARGLCAARSTRPAWPWARPSRPPSAG